MLYSIINGGVSNPVAPLYIREHFEARDEMLISKHHRLRHPLLVAACGENKKNYTILTNCHFYFRLEIPTMSGKFQLPVGYNAEMECRVLELPFSQKRISMFLLLPDDPVDGLANLEANISTENIQTLFSTLKVCLN